jgi:methylmalonyl-CoA mutase N-terminal domain/subunit
VQTVRANRSSRAVADALGDLARVAGAKESVMPAMLRAVEKYATVGEISSVLREAFGSFVEPTLS